MKFLLSLNESRGPMRKIEYGAAHAVYEGAHGLFHDVGTFDVAHMVAHDVDEY